MIRTSALTALGVTLAVVGCHEHTPRAKQARSAQRPAASAPASTSSAPAPAPSASGAGAALGVHVEDLTPPAPGAAPSKVEVRAAKGGLAIDMVEGLACDGHWVWQAHRTGPGRVTVRLSDENHSSMRSSCARMVHQRVRVPGLAPGVYHVHVAMPTGYGSIDHTITVH